MEQDVTTDDPRVTAEQHDSHAVHARLRHLSLSARTGIIAAVVAGVLVTIFAAQNGAGVRVLFLYWTLKSPALFVICLVSVGVGIGLGLLFSLVRWPRGNLGRVPSPREAGS